MKNFTFKAYNKNTLTAEGKVIDNKVYIKRYTLKPGIQQFYADSMDLYHLGQIFEGRLIPRNRAGIDEILKKLGLKEYNVFEMMRITHGVMRNDYVWFSFDDEDISYDEVKIR